MSEARASRAKKWAEGLAKARERMSNASDIVVEGTLNRMVGMTLEAVGCEAAVGGRTFAYKGTIEITTRPPQRPGLPAGQ